MYTKKSITNQYTLKINDKLINTKNRRINPKNTRIIQERCFEEPKNFEEQKTG